MLPAGASACRAAAWLHGTGAVAAKRAAAPLRQLAPAARSVAAVGRSPPAPQTARAPPPAARALSLAPPGGSARDWRLESGEIGLVAWCRRAVVPGGRIGLVATGQWSRGGGNWGCVYWAF